MTKFLGIWEQLNNPDFKPVEFDGIRMQTGLNSFTLTPKQWRQGQTTWNTDCADDADAHGYELQNPRISAQSASSAFPFRFDDYFINPRQIKLIHEPRFSGHYPKNDIGEHFADVSKMIVIGNEAKRRIERHFINFWYEKTTECTEDTENYSYNPYIA